MLRLIIDYLFYTVLKLEKEERLIQVLDFFVYDSIKIMLLLFVMIGILGFLRTFLPISKLKGFLVKRKILGSFGASLFGALTPFCSCSSIPIFLSLIKARVPLGAAFAFLITSPLVNEYLVVLMLGSFGIKITAAYVIFGILVGVIAGNIIDSLGAEKYIAKDIVESEFKEKKYKTFSSRLKFALDEALGIVKKLWIWILVGVGIGAIIHNLVPAEFIQDTIASVGVLGVPLATILGVPMYASCAAIVPVAVVLFGKGVPLGTALAFMMASSALSLPEAIILRRAMKLQLILIFFGVVSAGIIIIGYLLNYLQGILV